ncbi:uncharacterized protein [Ptychodera flava]|uniref:uncharacterized protein n=1 Tax=Ptychodera flava TaxID=63121 RepID=UPI00396A64CD
MASKFHILWISLLFVAIAGSHGARYKPTTLEIGTRYVARSVSTLLPGQRKVFAASTCGQFYGNSVNITVILNSNPTWNPLMGVVYFYVVDDPSKAVSAAMCSNNASGIALPHCSVSHWNSKKDLFVVANTGAVSDVSFTVNVQFLPKPGMEGNDVNNPWALKRESSIKFQKMDDDIYYLTQIAEISTTHQLLYREMVLLSVSFCADEETTDDYMIVSTVYGTDDISSFTQYICDQPDCSPDSSHVIAFNGNQLPVNTIAITAQHKQYGRLYVLLTCWSGSYNPAKKTFECNYQYIGTITPK